MNCTDVISIKWKESVINLIKYISTGTYTPSMVTNIADECPTITADPVDWSRAILTDAIGNSYNEENCGENNLTLPESYQNTADNLFVFPNPSNGAVEIYIPTDYQSGKLKIHDLQGKIILDEQLEGTATLRLNDLKNNSGILLLSISNGADTILNSKIVIQ